MLRPAAAQRNLFLKCRGPKSLPVEGDSLKLQRIVQNLLLNALKATQHGGVVVRWSAGTEKTGANGGCPSATPGRDSRCSQPVRCGMRSSMPPK